MTFDARRSRVSTAGSNNLVFAGIVAAVAGLAFLAVWVGPGLFAGNGASSPSASRDLAPTSLDTVLTDVASKRYFAALSEADPQAFSRLERRIKGVATDDKSELRRIVMNSAEAFMEKHRGTLARANVRHFNAMLKRTRQGLKSAAASNSKFCKGSYYASMENMSQRQARRMMDDILGLEGRLYEFSAEMSALMVEAVIDARVNPASYGSMRPSDDQAMQQLAMGLMTNSKIQPLIQAAQGGRNPQSVLRRVNVCQVADVVVAEFARLPDGTKARLWADISQGMGTTPFGSLSFSRGS